MSWQKSIMDYVEKHPCLSEWPDAHAVLVGRYVGAGEPMAALPILTCVAIRGNSQKAIPLAAGFTLLNLASEVLDDFQDQDPRSAWATWPIDRVLTATLVLIFLSQSCLARLDTDKDTLREIIDNYAQVGVLAAVGQGKTSPDRILSLDSYWAHTTMKSGLIFSVGAWSGVRLATRDKSKLAAARDFGLALGMLSQVEDDCRDFYNAASIAHPTEYFASLPVVMALEQRDHPSHHELANLLGQQPDSRDTGWSQRIHDLAVEMGGLAAAYGVAKTYEQKALVSLKSVGPSTELADYVRGHLQYIDKSI